MEPYINKILSDITYQSELIPAALQRISEAAGIKFADGLYRPYDLRRFTSVSRLLI